MQGARPQKPTASIALACAALLGMTTNMATTGLVGAAEQAVKSGPEVRVAQLSSDEETTKVRAVLKAWEEVVFVARISERLKTIPKRPGTSFKKGEVLVSFDCSELKARYKASRAVVNTSALDLKNKRSLRKLAAIGRHEVAMAKSEVNRAVAEAKVIGVQLRNCQIKAPFDGRVSEVFASAHETPARDAQLVSIVSDGKMELRIIVPSKWLSWLSPSKQFNFISDDTGGNYTAKVVAIGGKVDPVSQTIQVIADVENSDGKLLPGMSGDALFSSDVSG